MLTDPRLRELNTLDRDDLVDLVQDLVREVQLLEDILVDNL